MGGSGSGNKMLSFKYADEMSELLSFRPITVSIGDAIDSTPIAVGDAIDSTSFSKNDNSCK